jgi:hypothetical protein
VTGLVAEDRVLGTGVPVVDIVLEQECEVAAAELGWRSQGVVAPHRAEAGGVAAETHVGGRRIAKQIAVATRAVRIDEGAIFAVVDGVAAIAVGNAVIMECKRRRRQQLRGQHSGNQCECDVGLHVCLWSQVGVISLPRPDRMDSHLLPQSGSCPDPASITGRWEPLTSPDVPVLARKAWVSSHPLR